MRRMLLVVGAVVLLISAVVGCTKAPVTPSPEEEAAAPEEEAAAPEVTEWKIHTDLVETRMEFIMEKEFLDAVTEATGGRLKMTFYPGGALGFKNDQMLRLCGDNVIQGFKFWPGYYEADDPVLSLGGPEGIVTSREHWVACIPGFAKVIEQRLAKWNIMLPELYANPATDCGVYGTKEPYGNIKSLKGKKLRAWGVNQSQLFERLGAEPQVMAQTDMFLALKTGVLDGCLYTPNAGKSLSLNEVCQYFSSAYIPTILEGVAFSRVAFDALPSDLQNTFLTISQEYLEKWSVESLGFTSIDIECAAFLKEKGMTFLPPFSDAEKALIVETGIQLWRDRASALGPEGVEFQQDLEAIVEANRPA